MKRIGRSIDIHFVSSMIYIVETHTLVVHRRKDGTEYIVRQTREGRKRFTLDDRHNIFFTSRLAVNPDKATHVEVLP